MLESHNSQQKQELALLLEEAARRKKEKANRVLKETLQSPETPGASKRADVVTSLYPNRYCPQKPHPPQAHFLSVYNTVRNPKWDGASNDEFLADEILYGGAAGGAKSSAILMAGLQFVEVPGYAAIIFRKTFTDLSLPGGLMDRAREWLTGSDAKWDDKSHTWFFPSGASLSFGYMDSENAHFRYQGAEFQFIGFDELTQFPENQYLYLMSRLRRVTTMDVPLRMRSASNPGGVGHAWVKQRFITEAKKNGCIFIPSKLKDNPSISYDQYAASLMHLPPVIRAQLLEGNWDVTDGGKVISRAWFTQFLEEKPWTPVRVRAWDLAASADKDEGCRTSGVLMSRTADGKFNIEHVVKGHWRPGERDEIIKQTAETDGTAVDILIEEEPGSGGIAQNEHLLLSLAKWPVQSLRVTGDKVVRAGPFASAAHNGLIRLVRGEWLSEYLDELDIFPDGQFLDQVDATTLAYNYLAQFGPPETSSFVDAGEVKKEEDDDDVPKVRSPLEDYGVRDRNRIGRDWIRGRRLHGES